MRSLFFIFALLAMKAVADFYIYIFEVHRKDGDSLYGWQFFNGPPTCLQAELAEITYGYAHIRVEGTPYNPLLIEWHNSMGHWIVFKQDAYAADYALIDLGGNIRGWCRANTSDTWGCDWGSGFGMGASVLFCVSGVTADAAY